MSIDETVSFSLEVNVGPAYEEVRKLETIFSRSLGLVARLTGSEDLRHSIAVMQRAIAIANQLRLAYAALQAVRMASGDPLAWATAGVAVGSATVSMYEMTGR